jgi:hypothetical protein
MSPEKPSPKKSKEVGETGDPVDQIYLHFGDIKQRVPFRKADYGDDGALTDDQIEELARRFRLDLSLTRELSLLLGYSLDIDSEVSLVRVKRKQNASKTTGGHKEFESTYIDANGNEVLVRPLDVPSRMIT